MICVTGGERTSAGLRHRVEAHGGSGALQELRLDLLESVDGDALSLIGGETIVTCRAHWEGGGFGGSEHERADLLSEALARGPGYLDLEAAAPVETWRRARQARGEARLVASWHRFEPTPAAELERLLSQAPPEADVLKLAVAVEDAAELLPLLELSERRSDERPLLLIGMGPAGLLSRALYRRFGSPWTYVVVDGAEPVAPGQLTLGQVSDWRLREELTPLGLLGGPGISCSPGPRVYNRVFTRLGLPYLYLPVVSERAGPALALLERLGFAGCSVTMPLKEAVARLLGPGRTLAPADALGAVNTLIRRGDAWEGRNTDAGAIAELLAPHAGRPALVLGSGGAALAAAFALRQLGSPTAITGILEQQAEELASRLGLSTVPWEQRAAHTFEVLVNTTPCGVDGASDPIPGFDAWQGRVVLDAVLSERPTPLVRRARAGGAEGIEGIEWWVRQGREQMAAMTDALLTTEQMRSAVNDRGRYQPSGVDPIELRAPGSKSQTQRALILAALAPGETALLDPLDCDDSQVLRRALEALGVGVAEEGRTWRISGGALRTPEAPLWCGEAGTTSRFLTPLSLLCDELTLDGSSRLRERPLEPLLQALSRLGVAVERPTSGESLPVTLRRGAGPGSRTWIEVSHSSQFLSGLLLVGPCLPRGLLLEARGGEGGPVSRPYLDMTLEAMRRFGVEVAVEDLLFRVPPAPYRAVPAFQVEGDWSGAAFLLAGGRLAGREVRLLNMNADSSQGDRVMVEFLEELARPGPHRFDLTHCPDLIAPLCAASVTATHRVEIVGVAHARLKESDRVAVLARGLRAVGVEVEEREDSLTVTPGAALRPARLDPAGDHRMAMAFGLLSLLQPGIEVADRGCVTKSYPGFWHDLERLR
jgi:3-phosphoshikimate 1-carboxyvinyltransferase